MELVDTHCHLNHHDYDGDREAVIDRAVEAGVRRLLVIGYDLASSRRAVDLTGTHRGAEVYAIIGIHPESGSEWDDSARAELISMLDRAENRVVGYGEIGLDYHWETVPRERQREIFAEQIAFATSLPRYLPSGRRDGGSNHLPIVIHCRDAMDDVLDVLRESATPCPIVMHCFTGDIEAARKCLDAGYFLGIGGVATFKKTDEVRAAVAYAPIEKLILETDCPYLAPQKWRGKRNEPSYLTAVAETVASVKGISIEEAAASTTANAVKLFGLPD
jgi:TatD DNase family protein